MSRPWNVFFLFRDHLECLNIQHEAKTWALQQEDHSIRKGNFKQEVLPPWSPRMLPITFLCPWSKLRKLSELQAVSGHLFLRTVPAAASSILPNLSSLSAKDSSLGLWLRYRNWSFKSSQGSWRNVWSGKQVEAARSNLCSSQLTLVIGSS